MFSIDTLSGLMVLTTAAFAWFYSRSFTYYGGVFVSWVVLILFGLGIALTAKGIFAAKPMRVRDGKFEHWNVVGIVGSLTLSILAMPWVGFMVTSIAAYTCISLLITPRSARTPRSWLESLGVGTVAVLLFYGVFRYVLLVPLPLGALFS